MVKNNRCSVHDESGSEVEQMKLDEISFENLHVSTFKLQFTSIHGGVEFGEVSHPPKC